MSEKENDSTLVNDDGEIDFSKLKKKTKKKKEGAESEDTKKTAQPVNVENAETITQDGEIDFSMLKKKKKKKPAEDASEEPAQGGDGSGTATPTTQGGDEWLASDRDYTYDELLDRVFNIIDRNNSDMGVGRKRFTLMPPSIARHGNKKTVFANVTDICNRLSREKDHFIQYLYAELGTQGSIDGNDHLILKGRFQQKQIENIVRHYITEFVTCKSCRTYDTKLKKVNRLYHVICNVCGSDRTVGSIKTGFRGETKEDRRARREA